MRFSRPIHRLSPRKGNKMCNDTPIPAKVVFTPVAQIALIICETKTDLSFVEACKIAVALQTEGYCKAPF